ncbi:MAG: hypothetical protein JXB48_11920 [Candidatus Latescibacteria bacterium]|nr:hypothetical protein [Candidatus Latescibacterota bacterium]
MKNVLKVITLIVAVLLIGAAQVFAGIPGQIKTFLTTETTAIALTALITILGSFLGLLFNKLTRTFKETGEFMSKLGDALEDRKITRAELTDIIKEGRDIYLVWK